MLMGALSLVITLIPILNPTQFRLNGGESVPPLEWYGTGFAITAVVLGLAFWLNRKATKSDQESDR